jgi:hypothetical protein
MCAPQKFWIHIKKFCGRQICKIWPPWNDIQISTVCHSKITLVMWHTMTMECPYLIEGLIFLQQPLLGFFIYLQGPNASLLLFKRYNQFHLRELPDLFESNIQFHLREQLYQRNYNTQWSQSHLKEQQDLFQNEGAAAPISKLYWFQNEGWASLISMVFLF